MTACWNCHREISDTETRFCPSCGYPIGPPVTVPVEPPTPPAPTSPPSPTPPTPAGADRDSGPNRVAAYLALASAGLALIAAFQVWLRIQIGGFEPLGSDATGWDGGDGRTVAVAALAGIVVAVLLLTGRRDMWLKVTLFIAGGVTVVIAMANVAAANSKAHDIEVEFGIPADSVDARIGIGLWLVLVAGIGMLGAGLWTKTATA